MRILIKGGVWKNTEDEVLKAAVMKYGKNAWARVASLMNRKSAKQCKARWYEWLDPSIKKTEWSKDEEEKLLHLAKLMPNQWRTIAPIVGRTAAQCMEHYEKLLDQVQEETAEGSSSSEDPRRLRAGEIDPAPETKPARPDPIDMDEDEKEMLSEARARLANTKGKKAKRKLREQTMAEARRLSMLQKRRELKAAGIEMRLGGSKRKRFIDYGKEIPFQKVPPAGFYDVSEERQAGDQQSLDPVKHGIELAKLEGQLKKQEEERRKKKDNHAMKKLYEENAPLAVAQIAAENDPATLRRRNPLNLPVPQVSETELEEIIKIGEQSMGVMAPPIGAPGGGRGVTQALLADYSQTHNPIPTPMRTPLQEDIIKQEARNQLALRDMTSVLDDSNTGEVPELYGGTGYEGAMPRNVASATPNLLSVQATPLTVSGSVMDDSVTRMSVSNRSLIKSTPLRDQFGLNPTSAAMDDGFSVSDMGSIAASTRTGRTRSSVFRDQLSSQLKSLPEPEFTYEVSLPQNEKDMMVDDVDDSDTAVQGTARLIRDAGELQQELLRKKQLQEQEEYERRSSVIKRRLPRPTNIPIEQLSQPKKLLFTENSMDATIVTTISEMINKETIELMRYDEQKYPQSMSSNTKSLSSSTDNNTPINIDNLPIKYLKDANILLNNEINHIKNNNNIDMNTFNSTWDTLHNKVMFIPNDNIIGGGEYKVPNNKNEILNSLSTQFITLKTKFNNYAKKSTKIENKLQVTTQGYQNRSIKLQNEVFETYNMLKNAEIEKICFESLLEQEKRAIKRRILQLQNEVNNAELLEGVAQQQYADIVIFSKEIGIL